MKQFSEACERNKAPILALLEVELARTRLVLEVGSGTGQHAAHFARGLPHLVWQPSDLSEHHESIRAWSREAALDNLAEPLQLDIGRLPWPDLGADAVFTANTLHIVSWPLVECFFQGAAGLLPEGGALCVYGPFHYDGGPTSPSNAAFDAMLRRRDPASGIRDFTALDRLARANGMRFARDHAMPANNRLLVWHNKCGPPS